MYIKFFLQGAVYLCRVVNLRNIIAQPSGKITVNVLMNFLCNFYWWKSRFEYEKM